MFGKSITQLWRRACSERAMVSAELALTLPAVVLVLVAVLLAGAVSSAQVRVTEGARTVARALAMGQSEEVARECGLRLAGSDAQISIETTQQWVLVEVSRSLPGVAGWSGWDLRARASLIREDAWP